MKSLGLLLTLYCHVVLGRREAIAVLNVVNQTTSIYAGYVEFSQMFSDSPINIKIVLNENSALKDGLHGFHIHRFGNVKDSCSSATGHYNPLNKDHGSKDSEIRHVGDLGNIRIENNQYNAIMIDKMVSLYGQYSIIGRSVVLHSGQDDLGLAGDASSKKTGNAGPRYACGVIGIDSEGFDVSSSTSLSNAAWLSLSIGMLTTFTFLIS